MGHKLQYSGILKSYLSNTNSLKWDKLEKLYGKGDLLPLWVANMDFLVSPAISKALKVRLEHGVLGYNFTSSEHYESIIN